MNILELGYLRRDTMSIRTKNKACSVLSCRMSGSAIFNTKNRSIKVERGDIMFIPQGESYTQATSGEEVIYIHLKVFGSYYNDFQHISSQNPDEICEIFHRIADVWAKRSENYKFVCLSLLYSLIAKTSIMIPKEKNDILSKAMRYIDEQFFVSDFSLNKACSLSNVSRSYFNRIFSKEYGVTPITYINKLKVDKAKFLLLSGEYTHEEIARLCGFSDVKYFYTVFKKISGITAGSYQKKKIIE